MRLKNEFVKIEFNEEMMFFNLYNNQTGKEILSHCFSALTIEKRGEKQIISTFDYQLKPAWKEKRIIDEIGEGWQLSITFSDFDKPDSTLYFTLYEGQPYVTIQSFLYNKLGREIKVLDFQPFCISPEKGSKLNLGSNSGHWTFYKNGWQGHSPSYLLHLTEKESPLSENYENKYLINLGILGDSEITPPEKPGDFRSELMTAVSDVDTGDSLIIGFVSAQNQFSRIKLNVHDLENNQIELTALSETEGLILNTKDSLMSEKLFIDFYSAGLQALANYGSVVKKEMGVKVKKDIPAGWCSWYYFGGGITEEEVIRNIQVMSQYREDVPLRVALIDEGWQNNWGDWESNEKFPHGMKWLVERIEEKGFIPGLWLAPFTFSEKSHFYQNHPDWAIKDKAGKPVQVCEWRSDNIYGLDCSHPEAKKWLRELFKEVTQNWGYRYVKLDFIFGSAVKGNYHNSNMTSAQVYREGLKAIKESVGKEVFIAGCGSPVGPSVGLVDAMRIGTDSIAQWKSKDKYWASIRNGTRNTINRYFMHRKFWINDPDALLVRKDKTQLTLDEIHTQATVIGLSGGMVISGDNLMTLSKDRREIISRLLPIYGKSAIPMDFFEQETPRIFNLEIEKTFDKWNVVGIFNWEDEKEDFVLNFCKINLDPNKKYHLYSFWEEKYLGIFSKEIKFSKMKPHSCKLLDIKEVKEYPQLISSSFHITQGGVEISAFNYDKRKKQLKCRLSIPCKRQGEIFIYLPPDIKVKHAGCKGAKLEINYSEERLLKVGLLVKNTAEFNLLFEDKNN